LLSVLLKKCYCIASILTELLFEEFRLAIPIWRFATPPGTPVGNPSET
jgi:hypothetical protein